MRRFRFSPPWPRTPAFTAGDAFLLLVLAGLLYLGARLAFRAPRSIEGPTISLAARALPWYALLSLGRMTAAYLLSLGFSLVYGYAAARSRTARSVLMPLLDVLQSVPILSFLPVVLLSLTAVLPQGAAAELAAIVLIFTSQVWNLTFSFYQSLRSLPVELRESSAVFRLSPWLRFRTLELPHAAIGLVWNSMMSWSGGWFFLMAAEIFTVGARDFRLPGLGSYLQTAADRGDVRAILLGVGALVLMILLLDQLVWRPLLAWSDRFKLETVEADEAPQSWFADLMTRSWLARGLRERAWRPLIERLDRRFGGAPPMVPPIEAGDAERGARPAAMVLAVVLAAAAGYGALRGVHLMATIPGAQWARVGLGLAATLARVAVTLLVALAWTVPVGVLIGSSRRHAAVLQPAVQVVASIPATALFPIMLLALLRVPGGLDLAAILLMLMGTQWYLLFNVIAGASAIPQDLRRTTDLLGLSRLRRWRTLIVPALFPYLVTGAITASGGAWNASIVAEHVQFRGATHATVGIGALIAQATSRGDFALLLAGTLALVIMVVALNRSFWRRLYRLAEQRYRLD